jgi:hypothetical protein
MIYKSYAHGASSHPLLGETIGENLRKTVLQFAGKEALISVQQQYKATYIAFWQQVEAVAKSFLAINVQKGDRVAIWSPKEVMAWVKLKPGFSTAEADLHGFIPDDCYRQGPQSSHAPGRYRRTGLTGSSKD